MAGLEFISDPGHGWLAVPLADYPDAEQYGTGFGYVDRAAGVVYLEEDVEAGAFMDAHPHLTSNDLRYQHILAGDWWGRSLPRIANRAGE